MSEFSPEGTGPSGVPSGVPSAMPVLGQGKHRNPARGACFMEYTSVLAGETFTDAPRCVDRELAAVMRGANDKLSDADRALLVPLLGRAIGLAVEPPPPSPVWVRPAAARRRRREIVARYEERAATLHRAVSRRFMAAIGSSPTPATMVWSGHGEELAWLFWDLMAEPTILARSEEYVRRLIERLHVLHDCYEQAMDELGFPRLAPEPAEVVPAEPSPVAT